jgi:hypothetical protein
VTNGDAQERKEELLTLMRVHQRRLYWLRVQNATFGVNTPPEIEIEIEDIQRKLARVNSDLAELDPSISLPIIELPACITTFADRKREIENLQNRRCPQYVLIDAPVGYGKSRLLRELLSWYEQEGGWARAYVDFRAPTTRMTERSILDLIGSQLKGYTPPPGPARPATFAPLVAAINDRDATRGAILIFDSVEELDDRLVHWLLQTFTAEIFDRLDRIGYKRVYRVIFAGRHVAAQWEQHAGDRLSIHNLPPFDLNAVNDAVRSTADALEVALPESSVNHISHAILRCTGGHPDCIARVLADLAFDKFASFPDYLSPAGQASIYDETIASVITKIKHGIPASIRPAFETLSVFRRFEYHTIRHLIERGDIQWQPSLSPVDDPAWQLRTDIVATHMMRRDNGSLGDDIVRRLLAMELRHNDPTRFANLCHVAEKYYADLLRTPDLLPSYLATIERTFQRLQRYTATRRPARKKIEDELLTIFEEYLHYATNFAERQQRLEYLERELLQDWEWQFLAAELLEPTSFQHIRSALRRADAAPRVGGRR